MLDSTMELISLVASNCHLIFCFANLIIGILVVSNSKSASAPSRATCVPTTPEKVEIDPKREDNVVEKAPPIAEVAEAACLDEDVKECDKEVEEFDNDKNDDGEDGDEDEDELRRRAEEFIKKINRGWKAEKFGTCFPNVHNEQLHGLGRRLVM